MFSQFSWLDQNLVENMIVKEIFLLQMQNNNEQIQNGMEIKFVALGIPWYTFPFQKIQSKHLHIVWVASEWTLLLEKIHIYRSSSAFPNLVMAHDFFLTYSLNEFKYFTNNFKCSWNFEYVSILLWYELSNRNSKSFTL